VNQLKQSGVAVKSKVIYTKRKFERFDYHEGNINMQWTDEYGEKDEWNWSDEIKLMDSEIKKSPIYSDTFKLISKTYKVNEAQAEFWLSRFAATIARRAYEGLKEEQLLELVVFFIGDLEGTPHEWSPIVWLDGIWMKDEVVEVEEGIKLRMPKPEDLEFEQRLDMYPLMAPAMTYDHPSAILEFRCRAKNQPEVHELLEKLVTVLRLFKLSSVLSTRTQWISKSLLGFGGTHYRTTPTSATYKYPIGKIEAPSLQRFINRIMPLMPTEALAPSTETVNHVVIALQRYNDAVLKPEVVESRLTCGIMSLEALYLKANEREELSHRLSQRVARALSVFGYEPLEVYNMLRQAYEIRSKFIHGSKIEKDELQNATKLTEKTLEYARASIVMYLQLKEKIEKENFLNLVNNSMLNNDAHSKLNELLKQTCVVM